MAATLLDRVAAAVALAFLVWLFIGRHWNRRRAWQLARAARLALPALGAGASVRPLGSGAGGFLMEVAEPAPGIRSAQLLCLLEPRDFPLAWAWTRLRGRRDQIIVRVDGDHVLAPARVDGGSRAAARLGIARLVMAATQPTSPHVQISFGVAPGEEGNIERALTLAARLARGEERL
ncbi:MAG TPA: hypothetical protein VIK92_05690 [Thermaerobacter sp.]